MNKLKLLVLVFLYLGIFQVNLFSEISCRIEGTVEVEETGEMLAHAHVKLYCCDCGTIIKNQCCNIGRVETGENGFFRFDDLHEGRYFICIFRDGYANIGPLWEWKNQDEDPLPGYNCITGRTSAEFKTFFLNEGQIKHFKFKMEREAVIEVSVIRKTFSGMEQLNNDDFVVLLDLNNTNFTDGDKVLVEPDFNRTHRFPGLAGGRSVQVQILTDGWPSIDYNIYLEKGKVESIYHVLDFTTGQVVYGVIKKKGTGEPLSKAFISVGAEFGERISGYADENGRYWFGGLEPGVNVIYINSRSLQRAFFKVEIQKNQQIKFDIEI